MLQLDSLALVSMGSFLLLFAVTVLAAPRRDRTGAARLELAALLAGTLLAYAAAALPVFLAGWALTVWPSWRGQSRGARLVLAASTVLLAGGAALMSHPPVAFVALAAAVLLRKGIFPFHRATLGAFERMPLPAVGLTLNSHLGGYLLIRFVIPRFPALSAEWLPHLSILALVTSVFMALAALGERQPRRLLGLLWISQGSFILAGLATNSQAGITGALMQWWVVAFAMTGMMSVYASLEARTSSVRSPDEFLGLAAHAPRLGVFFTICGLALVGLPGTLGFVAEDLLFHGALEAHPLLGVALPVATALNAISVLRLLATLFMGRRAIHVPPVPDALPRERLALSLAVGLLIFGGLMPALLIALRTPSAEALTKAISGK